MPRGLDPIDSQLWLTTPSPSYQQAIAPAVGGSTSSTAPAYAAPPASAKAVPDWQTMQGYLLGSPFYKQGLETMMGSYNQAQKRASESLAYADQQDATQKARAAHDLQMQQKAIRESLAGRGMLDSGQTGFEMGQSQYSFDNLMADIKAAAEQRQQQAGYAQSDLEQQMARDRYTLLTNTASFYRDLWWDPQTGAYVGPGA